MDAQGRPPAPRRYEEHVAEVVARAFVPVGTLGGVTDGVAAGARVLAQIAGSPWQAALAVRAALWMIWLSPLVSRRPRLFDALSPPEQEARLAALERARSFVVRELVLLVKLYSCMAVLGTDDTLARLGAYQHAPPVTRWRIGRPA